VTSLPLIHVSFMPLVVPVGEARPTSSCTLDSEFSESSTTLALFSVLPVTTLQAQHWQRLDGHGAGKHEEG